MILICRPPRTHLWYFFARQVQESSFDLFSLKEFEMFAKQKNLDVQMGALVFFATITDFELLFLASMSQKLSKIGRFEHR